mgnify:CR=1 FL=1
MHMQWVVVADQSRARIFQTSGQLDELVEIDDLLNPSGRQDDSDLRKDAKGRFYGKGERDQAHTAEPHVTQEEHAADRFSREVMAYLEHANHDHRFESLVMIAPPEFLGLLRKQLSKNVETKVRQQLATDISGLHETQIRDYLRRHVSPYAH